DSDEAANSLYERNALAGEALTHEVTGLLSDLASARRPVILAGSGVRLSGMHDEFLSFVRRIGAPVVTAWNSHDLVTQDHPLYLGRPGTVGDRAGNLAVQTADFVLILGCRLNIRQISYNWQSFAKNAKVAMVDIDRAELTKPTVNPDRAIHADLRDFFRAAQN